MTRPRLFSSGELISALVRAGFEPARKSKGSHQAFKRKRPDGRHDVVIVPLAQKQIPRGTFDSILEMAHMSYDEFLRWAGVRRTA